MTQSRERIVVAMSGGVDSSVAACLLKEQGYEVIGLFMRHGQGGEPPPPTVESQANSVDAGANTNDADATPICAANGRSAERVESKSGGRESMISSSIANAIRPNGSSTRVRQGCCSASDAADARFVAGMLGIPFYALNFEKDFERLIDGFADEYARGRTPNPCVVCNHDLKFGRIMEYADLVGARYVATGHYARVVRRGDRIWLGRARDRLKDQSYVLFGLDRETLERVRFPLGGLTKSEVRAEAARRGFPNHDKPDSVEICFVPDGDYAGVVRRRRPEAFVRGDVVDRQNQLLGRHAGIAHFTVGQRRGLGIAAGQPMYVERLDPLTNTVTLATADDLLRSDLKVERVRYPQDKPTVPFRATVQIRYLHRAAWATLVPAPGDVVDVRFDDPQRAITPGQAAVFYDEDDLVLGGGWIGGSS